MKVSKAHRQYPQPKRPNHKASDYLDDLSENEDYYGGSPALSRESSSSRADQIKQKKEKKLRCRAMTSQSRKPSSELLFNPNALQISYSQQQQELNGLFKAPSNSENRIQSFVSSSNSSSLHLSPSVSKKATLVLDLDNTLVHAMLQSGDIGECSKLIDFDISSEDILVIMLSETDCYFVKIRPYVNEFLKELHEDYDFVIYTKGSRNYAELMIDMIDPDQKYLSKKKLIAKEDAKDNEDNLALKTLSMIDCDSTETLILDDSPSIWDSKENLIYTKPFYYFDEQKDKTRLVRRRNDCFLLYIKEALKSIRNIQSSLLRKGMSCVKISEIYKELRQNALQGVHASFIDLFANEEEMKKSTEYKCLVQMGAKCTFEVTDKTNLLFSRLEKLQAVHTFIDLPILSLWYLSYCEMLCGQLPTEQFDLRNEQSLAFQLERAVFHIYHSKGDKEKERQMALKSNQLKDMVEEYLAKNSSKGKPLGDIEDLVFNNLLNKQISKRKLDFDVDEAAVVKKVHVADQE